MSHIGYFSKKMYIFVDDSLVETSSNDTRVIIVAKNHYVETWQSFAAINKKELRKLIELKKSSQANQIFQIFDNKSIDGFDVKITTFDETLAESLGDKKILIPETELYTNTALSQHIYQIETLNGTLFCSTQGVKIISSYAKGGLLNLQTYKLSIGLPNETETTNIERENFPYFVINQLLNQQIDVLAKKITAKPSQWFDVKQLHYLYLGPLLTALVFFSISNTYLTIRTDMIEDDLAQGGEQVRSVLTKKQRYDEKVSQLTTLSNEYSDRKLVHYYWSTIYQLVENDMTVTRITYTKGKLIIRGVAEKASDVLSAIATYSQVESASFQGPVRKSRGKDSFILEITPTSPPFDVKDQGHGIGVGV